MLKPPIAPMLAKLSTSLPEGDGWLYEPKWDGFRALVFRDGSEVYLQSRDLKPFNRYFPELLEPLAQQVPQRCVLDGEIVIASPEGHLDFDALLLRIHPAESRIKLLAARTPSSYVAFDLLALDGEDLIAAPQEKRRALLEKVLSRDAARLPDAGDPRSRGGTGLVLPIRRRGSRRRGGEAARRRLPA